MNVTLIGMPGSGKSFIGRKLADALEINFADPDKLLEEQHAMPLEDVLKALGEKTFLEAEAAASIAAFRNEPLVLATGGSIIYSTDAMREVAAHSRVIYLTAPYDEIERRVGTAPRGIVGLGPKSLRQIYDERVPLYESWAQASVSAADNPEQVIASIRALL